MMTNYKRTNIKFLTVLYGMIEGFYCDLTMNKDEALFLDTWLLEIESSVYLDPLSLGIYNEARKFTQIFLSFPDGEPQGKILDELLTVLEHLQDKIGEQLDEAIADCTVRDVNKHSSIIITNEFQGLCKGLIADGHIAIEEVRCLADWLDENAFLQDDPIISKFYSFFEENDVENLSSNGFERLKRLLVDFCGSDTEGNADGMALGESFFDLVNELDLNGKVVQLTGKFKYGSRKKCSELAISQGAIVIDDFRLDLDYLIVGMFNSRDWLQQSYGKKIMIAKEYQAERNHKVKIISESQWVK